jgi:hypothetical protein
MTATGIERINRPEARRLAEDEFERFAEVAAALTDEEWAMPTDCTAWDVRKLSLHVLGSGDAQASVREFMHQMRRGMPLNRQIDSHHWVDGMNELQIREREKLSNADLVGELMVVGPKAVKGRWGTPLPMRYLPIPFGPPIGWAPLKYLLDMGFTRDVWRHRSTDAADAGARRAPRRRHRRRMGVHPRSAVRVGPRGARRRQVRPGLRRRAC